MFGIGDDYEDEHFLAGTQAAQFAGKPDTLKWRNGYLPSDVSLSLLADDTEKLFKKGTLVRVYEGELSPEQCVSLFGGPLPTKTVKIPGPKGNWIIETPPTAPNQWTAYPGASVPLTDANKADRFKRLYLGPQDPADLVPLSEGADKSVTDNTLNAIGAAAPATTTTTTTTTTTNTPPPPKKEEGGGLTALAIAGGILLLLSKGK